MSRLLLIAALLLAPFEVHAQGGMLLAPGTQADFSSRQLADGATQLQVVFIWRGAPGWDQMTDDEYRVGKQMLDSAVTSARARRQGVNGTITPRGEALMLIDHDASIVTVKGVRYKMPARDSVVVIVLDRVDGVGGPPKVDHFTLAWPADSFRSGEAMTVQEQLMRSWRDKIAANPRVRALLAR